MSTLADLRAELARLDHNVTEGEHRVISTDGREALATVKVSATVMNEELDDLLTSMPEGMSEQPPLTPFEQGKVDNTVATLGRLNASLEGWLS
jgi:hypothetical protein